MSRRERRDSDSRRHRSRFDQEPSPKRSRRDGKPETERPPADVNLDSRDNSDRGQKHHRRLQDVLPHQAPIVQVSKEEAGAVRKDSDKANVNHEGTKHSLDPTEVPRSQSYFQHDERGNPGQVNRSSNGKAATGKERGWWRDPQEQLSERTNRISTGDMQKKDERSRVQGDERNAWRHDRYYDMEADPKSLSRKRPSFREKKISDDSEKAHKAIEETNANEHPLLEHEKRENRGNNPYHLDRTERGGITGDREANKAGSWRSNFSSRDRYSGRVGNYRGGERFTARQGGGERSMAREGGGERSMAREGGGERSMARQGYRPTDGRVEKWKHDLFDEANRSPSPKKEEDMVAKVEALLTS